MKLRFAGPALFVLGDVVLVNLALLAALALRFDGHIPSSFYRNYVLGWGPLAAITVATMHFCGLYRGIWRYAGLRTLVSVVRAVTIASLPLLAWSVATGQLLFPRSTMVLTWLLQITFLGALRMTPRFWREVAAGVLGSLVRSGTTRRRRVLIVGAGDSGAGVVREMLIRPDRGYVPIGFVDDNPAKLGLDISGVRVLGSSVDIPRIVRESGVKDILIAAPSAPARLTRDILNYCRQVDVQCLTLPALADYIEGRTPLNQIRAVRIEDLVGREQVEIDLSQIGALVAGKTILVTGAGGSIGSEICRQVARLKPRAVLLLDHAENGLYFCYRDLVEDKETAGVEMATFVADIKDRHQLDDIFRRHHPEIIFHAAAHKHVPLLEANPREAVLNNIVGTRNLIDAALAADVKCFVQISTDKAVRPTSVMGASKRICEMLVAAARPQHGQFVSVRFGNVMDSAGSVIPLFRRQIARGGPVTVTHPDARRYFMTISEAVRLVLQAAALGRAGEIFLLDMGEPVRIMDLAEQMVRLSGLVPGRDIEIREIGLRPGEKMLEQLVSESVPSRSTEHKRIRAYQGEPVNAPWLEDALRRLTAAAEAFDRSTVIGLMQEIIPDFRPAAAAASASAVTRPATAGAAAEAVPLAASPLFDSLEEEEKVLRLAARPERAVRAAMRVKRWLDLAAGMLLMPLAIPAMALVSLALSVELGSPLLVQERRIGRNRRQSDRRNGGAPTSINRRVRDRRRQNLLGQPITLWRFRTLPEPEAVRAGFAAQNPRFARFVERQGLDRLPWLFGLMHGHLGLVGPEPIEWVEAERLSRSPNGFATRFTLRPGLTGLAQVLSSSERSLKERFAYDFYYMGKASPLLDLRILARSSTRRLSGNGASGNGHGNGNGNGNGDGHGNGKGRGHGDDQDRGNGRLAIVRPELIESWESAAEGAKLRSGLVARTGTD